jgi:hypothetical protein
MSEAANIRAKFYEIIKTFKEQIITLLQDTSLGLSDKQRRENIRKMDNMYDKLLMAKSANSRLPIEFFYKSLVVPYGPYILKQDEQFFLRESELVDNSTEVQFGILVDEIRVLWNKLDDTNKKIIWRYVLALCKVSDSVVGENYLDQLKQQLKSQ